MPSRVNYSEASRVPVFIVAFLKSFGFRASSINILPLGSDLPVVGINPLLGFYAAVSRLSVEGESPHGSGGW